MNRGSIQQSFERQAELTPSAIALVAGAEQMTYRDLNERANQVGRFLREKGVKDDSLVAVCLDRSIEMIVSLLGVLKAGGAYVPLEPSNPRARIEAILSDVQANVVLTQERFEASFAKCRAEIVSIDRNWPAISEEPARNLESLSGVQNLAYVIFTSGSTGTPKGVMVAHGNVLQLLDGTRPLFQFDNDDVWTFFHSYAFDFSVWEIWGCLLTGGKLIIVPTTTTRSPQDFYDLLSSERVTILNQTPVAFRQIIQLEESGYVKPLSLQHVIFGGEALVFSILRPWFKRHGDQIPQLTNMYGITETTVHVTYRPLSASDCETESRSLIGVPIPGWSVRLLDDAGNAVATGVEGEIYVGGAGVARGYLNRAELSAKRFVSDPFTLAPEARMYKSGDLARFLLNGDLEYLGRADSQVKIHGFRIEPGEIESTLLRHPGVSEATVVARTDGPGEKKLVAYVVPKKDATYSTSELRSFLQERLPSHMVPYAYVKMSSIPLTPNGKVDRAQLPSASVSQGEHHVAMPASELERSVADIWREVLRLKHISLDDNFFDLGGDSLLLVSVQASLQRLLNVRIPVAMLFDFTTIRTLSGHLANSDMKQRSFSDVREQAQKQHEALERARKRQNKEIQVEEIL